MAREYLDGLWHSLSQGGFTMELDGMVRNGVVVVDRPELLPEGGKVKVLVETPDAGAGGAAGAAKPTLATRLLRHAGTVPGLPPDLAEQHDHYIRGTPKR